MYVKHLESRQNSTAKYLMKLKTKKGRLQHQKYIVDGLRIVEHAIQETHDLDCVLVSETFYNSELMSGIEQYQKETYVLTNELFHHIVETENPQGIAAVIKMNEKKIQGQQLLFLDAIQDPGNLGTLIRTAEAAGFGGVLLKKGCTDPYGQKALRSSMGSIMSIPIHTNCTVDDLNQLKGFTIYGAALSDGQSYKSYEYTKPFVLVIGNEANGITKEVLDICHHRVFIPMIGKVESLNASIAGGILMFEMTHLY